MGGPKTSPKVSSRRTEEPESQARGRDRMGLSE